MSDEKAKAAPKEFDFLFNGENIRVIDVSAYQELWATFSNLCKDYRELGAEYTKLLNDGDPKQVKALKNKLAIAADALKEIKKDQWVLLRRDLDKIKYIALEALQKLGEA